VSIRGRMTAPRSNLYYRPGERIRYHEPGCPNPNFGDGVILPPYALTLQDDIKFYALYTSGAVGGKTEMMIGMSMSIGL